MSRRYPLHRYLTGAAVARTGDELSGPALLLVGIAVSGSASTASALLAALTISAAIGGPAFGAILDRSGHPGRVLAVALALYALTLAVVLAGLGRFPTALVIAMAATAGLFNPAIAGGWTAQLPAVLGGSALGRGSALDAMTFSAASLLGPGMAGLVSALAGAPAAMAVAIGLLVAALPAAWTLPSRPRPPKTAALWRRFATGFGAIAANRSLSRATATSMVSYVGVGMAVVCYPLLGQQRLGGASNGALLLSALATAALLANAVLAKKSPQASADAIVCASTVVLAAGMLLAAAGATVPTLVFAAAVTGLGEGPQLTALFTIRHREAPEPLRAQIFTTAASLKTTGFAVGAALAGPLATWSVTGCLLGAAGAQLVAFAIYLAYPLRKPSPARAA